MTRPAAKGHIKAMWNSRCPHNAVAEGSSFDAPMIGLASSMISFGRLGRYSEPQVAPTRSPTM